MSDFLKWHPSAPKGVELYATRKSISELAYNNPAKAFHILTEQWNFGKTSELWDDYVFSNCIQPVLDKNASDALQRAIQRYSIVDHLLFLTYIRRTEDPIRFRRAFWNVNSYGQKLARKFFDSRNGDKEFAKSIDPKGTFSKNIAFVLKGPYQLAHVEFLQSFLQGTLIFSKAVTLTLLLIDDPGDHIKNLQHITIKSLASIMDPYKKIEKYYEICLESQFDHICWVACVQNLSLYMGMQLAPEQSYWSMKYHSIIMPTIQKYAGLGFGRESFIFDHTKWFRGRAFPTFDMNPCSPEELQKLKKLSDIPLDALVVGCFVRAEKLHQESFWDSIVTIIQYHKNIHFVIASQSLPADMNRYLSQKLGDDIINFHHLGWVDTKKWAYNLDIYYDSYPRGSCNTIFEAIEAKVPILMADTEHNRESSALPYLSSASQYFLDSKEIPGVYNDEKERLRICASLLSNSNQRQELAAIQHKMLLQLKGQSHLFAKDYLNYFLSTKMQIKDFGIYT